MKYNLVSQLKPIHTWLLLVLLWAFCPSCGKESHIELSIDSTEIAKVFQPGEISGKDAIIQSMDVDSIYLGSEYLAASAWTNGGKFNKSRALIEFDLSIIPAQTQIDSASLSLFWVNHNILPGQTGENAFSVHKITENWQEYTVSWNNQPAFSTQNAIDVSKSIKVDQSYFNINVTNFVQEMINNSTRNYGFMIKLREELPYRLVIFGSSNHPDNNKHPKLVVYY